MLYIKNSFNLIGILNQKCAILPLLIRSATISKEATTITIYLYDLTLMNRVLYKKVLSVLFDLSIKKHLNTYLTANIIALYAVRWSLFNKEMF